MSSGAGDRVGQARGTGRPGDIVQLVGELVPLAKRHVLSCELFARLTGHQAEALHVDVLE